MPDKDYAIVLVWLERNNGRVYLQDRSVVSSRHSTNSTQMGPGTRPRGRTGNTSVLLHRPQYGSFRNHRDLCNAMGNGGHIPGGACAPRNRNSTPVVRKSDHAHHTNIARHLQSGLSLGAPNFGNKSDVICCSVVKKDPLYILRCNCCDPL